MAGDGTFLSNDPCLSRTPAADDYHVYGTALLAQSDHMMTPLSTADIKKGTMGEIPLPTLPKIECKQR
jgi:hypothetical protein